MTNAPDRTAGIPLWRRIKQTVGGRRARALETAEFQSTVALVSDPKLETV